MNCGYLRAGLVGSLLSAAVFAASPFTASADDFSSVGVVKVELRGYDGSETLTNFPVLVRFSAANINGLYAELLSKEGDDVRVYGEDGVELAFDIESWNPEGESLIWVKIPELPPIGEKVTSVYVKWGETEISKTDPKDVWTEYLAVWHMNDTTTLGEATGNGCVLSGATRKLGDGVVGKAILHTDSAMTMPDFVCGEGGIGENYTISCWYKYTTAGDGAVISKGTWADNGRWYTQYKGSTTKLGLVRDYGVRASLTTKDCVESWNYNAVINNGGEMLAVVNDAYSLTSFGRLNTADNYRFAVSHSGSLIDELRIKKSASSAAWTRAECRTQSASDFVTYTLVQNPVFEDVMVLPSATPPVVDEERTLTIGYRVVSTGGSTVEVSALYAIEGAATTNETVLGSAFDYQVEDVFGTVADLCPGTNYWVAVRGKNASGKVSKTTQWQRVTVPGPVEIRDVVLTQTADKTIVSGGVTGLGTTTAKLRYAFGDGEFTEVNLDLGEDGAFSVTIDRASWTDVFKYQIVAQNTLATPTWGNLTWNAQTKVKTAADSEPVTYTWKGGAAGLWADPANWEASTDSAYGFPNSKTYATAKFTQAATVDLGGGTFGLVKEGLKFSNKLGEVTLCNGTISVPSEDFGYGANGTTVIFDNVTISGQKGLKFVAGSTVVFKGTTSQGWLYEPWNPDGKTELKFVDGLISSGYFQSWLKDSDDHRVTIDNAVWTLTSTKASSQLATKYFLLDGVDRQAQLVSLAQTNSLAGTWYIPIPADGHAKASIVGKTAANAGGTFQLEVKDWKRGIRVPLVQYTGADQTSTIQGLLDSNKLKLSVLVDGEPESEAEAARRNGRLVWDEATNTLYYEQNSLIGFLFIVR